MSAAGQATVGALDIGGSHVTAGLVDMDVAGPVPWAIRRRSIDPHAGREALLDVIVGTAVSVARRDVHRWGVAVPGPFDYDGGVATIRGVDKLDGLYGVDLRAELADALSLPDPQTVGFLNDADAYLLGEWWAGAARGHARAMGVTLGTGLGSAFLDQGQVLHSGAGVPTDARLDLIPFRGQRVEDVISSRGLHADYRRRGVRPDPDGVDEIARRAREGEAAAVETFESFGGALRDFLRPWLDAFTPTCLVVGGSIARAWDLFERPLRECSPDVLPTPADNLDDAPLRGAAYHAAHQ